MDVVGDWNVKERARETGCISRTVRARCVVCCMKYYYKQAFEQKKVGIVQQHRVDNRIVVKTMSNCERGVGGDKERGTFTW